MEKHIRIYIRQSLSKRKKFAIHTVIVKSYCDDLFPYCLEKFLLHTCVYSSGETTIKYLDRITTPTQLLRI